MLDPHRCDRLLIYGGGFDPPHRAHVELPAHVGWRIGADGVLYVPTGHPPHKTASATPADHRLAMLELTLRDREDAAISTVELDREGPSYTVDTLRQLRDELGPTVELCLLIGADMAAMFYSGWRDSDRIVELAEPVVMMRPPYDADGVLAQLPADLPEPERRRWRDRIVPTPTLDITSTQLRSLLRSGRYDDPLVRGMMNPAVIEYIRSHGLYREGAGRAF